VSELESGDLTARLQVVLGRLARQLRRASPAEVGAGGLSAMSTLAAEGPLRPTDLAAREGVRPPTMTRMLAVLEESGYVVRTVDPADRRASLIELTTRGSAVLLETRSARAHHLARRLTELSGDQRRALADALPALETLVVTDQLTPPSAPRRQGGAGTAASADQ